MAGMVRASDSLPEIDLTSFHEIPSIHDATETPIQNIAYNNTQHGRRFYITGLWGPSAAWLSDPGLGNPNVSNASATIFTAGIAGGISLERERGRLRLETEWLQRDFFKGTSDEFGGSFLAIENWSVMANVWRDFMITERFGCYGGGGIGGGGMNTGVQDTPNSPYDFIGSSSAFAWQAGGGILYELNDQITCDVSYRWYQVNNLTGFGTFDPVNTYRFTANQVMFSLRVFEPLGFLRR